MIRYAAFDPPEYLDWTPDPEVLREFSEAISADAERHRIIQSLTDTQHLDMYAGLLRFRLHDITLRRWVKQGVLSKAWLGTGEEAVTIGSVHALDRRVDHVGPMIRNAGACHEMGIPVVDLLREYLATADSPSRGKDLHVGDLRHNVIAPASQVAALAPVVAGVALSFRQRGEKRVVLTWVGDGATKTTASHEGINLAAVLKVPVIYVFQNNQIALGTRFDQHQVGPFTSWAKAYGVRGISCAGNNVLDVFAATRIAADHARNGLGPVILFAETFRMGGHATHDEKEARSTFAPNLFTFWGKRDPIGMYESHLLNAGFAESSLRTVEERVIAELADAEKAALESRDAHMPKPESLLLDVYGPEPDPVPAA